MVRKGLVTVMVMVLLGGLFCPTAVAGSKDKKRKPSACKAEAKKVEKQDRKKARVRKEHRKKAHKKWAKKKAQKDPHTAARHFYRMMSNPTVAQAIAIKKIKALGLRSKNPGHFAGVLMAAAKQAKDPAVQRMAIFAASEVMEKKGRDKEAAELLGKVCQVPARSKRAFMKKVGRHSRRDGKAKIRKLGGPYDLKKMKSKGHRVRCWMKENPKQCRKIVGDLRREKEMKYRKKMMKRRDDCDVRPTPEPGERKRQKRYRDKRDRKRDDRRGDRPDRRVDRRRDHQGREDSRYWKTQKTRKVIRFLKEHPEFARKIFKHMKESRRKADRRDDDHGDRPKPQRHNRRYRKEEPNIERKLDKLRGEIGELERELRRHDDY